MKITGTRSTISKGGLGETLNVEPDPWFLARVSDVATDDGRYVYTLVEVEPDNSDFGYTDVANGTKVDAAYELNGSSVSVDTVVLARFRIWANDGTPTYEFSGGSGSAVSPGGPVLVDLVHVVGVTGSATPDDPNIPGAYYTCRRVRRIAVGGSLYEVTPVIEYTGVCEFSDRLAVVDDSGGTVTHELPLYLDANGVYSFGIDQYASGSDVPDAEGVVKRDPGHDGLVSATLQTFEGEKRFRRSLQVNTSGNSGSIESAGTLTGCTLIVHGNQSFDPNAPSPAPYTIRASSPVGAGAPSIVAFGNIPGIEDGASPATETTVLAVGGPAWVRGYIYGLAETYSGVNGRPAWYLSVSDAGSSPDPNASLLTRTLLSTSLEDVGLPVGGKEELAVDVTLADGSYRFTHWISVMDGVPNGLIGDVSYGASGRRGIPGYHLDLALAGGGSVGVDIAAGLWWRITDTNGTTTGDAASGVGSTGIRGVGSSPFPGIGSAGYSSTVGSGTTADGLLGMTDVPFLAPG